MGEELRFRKKKIVLSVYHMGVAFPLDDAILFPDQLTLILLIRRSDHALKINTLVLYRRDISTLKTLRGVLKYLPSL